MTERYPPGPERSGLLGAPKALLSLLRLVRDPLNFVDSRFENYGDIYHIDEGKGRHLYVVRHPELIREVLVKRVGDFQKRGGANDRLVTVLGEGLLTADGAVWKEARKLVGPHFRKAATATYAGAMVNAAEGLRWPDGEVVDVSEAMMKLTLGIVCKALFDHDVTSEADAIAGTMDALRRATDGAVLPDWLPLPSKIRARRAIAETDALLMRMVAERRAEGPRDDLLSMLLGVGKPDRWVRDQLLTLFLAGHETTSHALSWSWWLLATHPEVEAKLHAELDALGRAPQADDDLPYTTAVVSEAMRLYPPAYAIPRVASRPTQLGEFELEEGAQVVSWIWHCHHDERWFEDPEAFRPARFLEEASPKAYMPFGAGTRMCVGAGFATMELRLLLASLARRYRLEKQPGQQVEGKAGVTLAPKGGLPLRVRARAPALASDR